MSDNKLQIKRTTVASRTPNTTNSANTSYIDVGELAINVTDGKLFSSNGTVLIEIGSKLSTLAVNSIFTVNSTSVSINSDDSLRFNDGSTQNTAFQVYDSSGTRIA